MKTAPAMRPLDPRRSRATSVAALVATGLAALVAMSAGCDDASPPPGPPRCEPETELWTERLLKEGYRSLLLSDDVEARRRFERVLVLEPGHPEALRGLATPAGAPDAPAAPGQPAPGQPVAEGVVRIGGQARPFTIPVIQGRFDFETLRALAPLRAAQAGPNAAPPSHSWYSPRDPAADGDALSNVDLIVLHDTHTATVAEAFATFEYNGASTHFIIEADGTVFQTLDLSLEANHTRTRSLDTRSIAVDLVNPVDLDSPPGSSARPLSDFVSLQGRAPVQEHGYTDAQLDTLGHLILALCEAVPSVPCALPELDGAVPRAVMPSPASVRGIAGHLHVSPIAFDPGAGFPWERLQSVLTSAGPK
jgi:hypothetical protein